MGIHGFYSQFIKKKYPEAIVDDRNLPQKVYGLYLDLNGLLHRCKFITFGGSEGDLDPALLDNLRENGIKLDMSAQNRALRASKMTEAQLLETYKNVFSTLLITIITAYSPIVELGLYVDGVVPNAKIQQQRQRREKAAQDRDKYTPFDGNQITPGTPFMFWVDSMIKEWIERNLNRNFVPTKIIYSNHLVPGEGEHKIMDHLRVLGKQFKGYHNEYSYIVYGLDADLIVLSLLQELEGIYLTREDIVDNINIDDLRIRISQEVPIADFCVMMSFIGNDFLPNIMSSNMTDDLNAMFNVYKKKKLPLSIEGKINWEGMLSFLKGMDAYEQVAKYNKLALKDNIENSILNRSFRKVPGKGRQFIYEIYRNLWYQHVFKNYGNVAIAEKYSFDKNQVLSKSGELKEGVIEEIDDMCYEYLKGIEWVLRYYTRGHHEISHRWFYPYHYAPLMSDFYRYVENKKSVNYVVKYVPDGGYTVLHQLFSVIPKNSLDILPPQLQKLAKSLKYTDMYPDLVKIDKEGSTRDWISVVLTPFVDRRRVQVAIQSILKDFTYDELVLYTDDNEIIYETGKRFDLRMMYKKKLPVETPVVKKEDERRRRHILETFDFKTAKVLM